MSAFDASRLQTLEQEIGRQALSASLRAYVDELESLLLTLKAALSADDELAFDEIERTAHTLKSTAATFGATSLNQCALKLEEAARAKAVDLVSELAVPVVSQAEEARCHFSTLYQ